MSKAEGFAAVPNWMIREKRVPRNAVLVYASLASRSGLGGIHPSQATIAQESGLSERTVRSMLAELEKLGVIERLRRTTGTRGRGNRLPDGYTLHPMRLSVSARAHLASVRRCAVYRFYDSTGELLYVGKAVDPVARQKQHEKRVWWVDVDTTRTRVAWYPNERSALDAEYQAIRDENPLYNRIGGGRS